MKDDIIQMLKENGCQVPLSDLTEMLKITRETLPAFSTALLALQHARLIIVQDHDSDEMEDIIVLNATVESYHPQQYRNPTTSEI